MHNLKKHLYSLAFVFAAFFVTGTQAYSLEIKGMRFGHHGTSLRVVMDMDAEADFRAMVQDNPPRVVIDMPAISGKPVIKRSAMPAEIADIRLEPLAGTYSRLTFMMDKQAVIRGAFLMPAQGAQSARLVVDMAPAGSEVFLKQVGKSYGTLTLDTPTGKLPFAATEGAKLKPIGTVEAPTRPAVNAPEAPTPAAAKDPESLPLVMIDAGHGGFDPGAVQGGTREKDITLAVAKALRTSLLATGRYRVDMTRDKDVFIRLPERVRIARRAGADLFVSIHADSAPEAGRSAQGASIYTLSDKASDAQAARLAARENQVDMLAGAEIPENDREVAAILIDLATRETANQSAFFARQLVAAFNKQNVPLLNSPHKQAGFMVLKAPDIPSVLIELGFLSNPDEVKKLNDETYRKQLADSIAKGVDGWLKAQKR